MKKSSKFTKLIESYLCISFNYFSMTSFPPISAKSGFIVALLVGLVLFVLGYELVGSLVMIAGVTLNYIAVLSLK
jgi:hypothetical protein